MTEQDKKLIISLWESGEPKSYIVQLLPYKPYQARLMIEELKKILNQSIKSSNAITTCPPREIVF